MAASSVTAVKALPTNLDFFDLEAVKLNGTGFWASAHVPITSGSVHSDEEDDTNQRATDLKQRFHSGRYLHIRQIPRDATEKDIIDAFQPELELYNVQLQPAAQSATAQVRRPELLEEPGRYCQVTVLGHTVSVSLSATDGLLCAARLPFTTTDHELTRTAEQHGPVRYAFVLRSETTAASKGYGFIMYASKEAAFHAKNLLDGKMLGSSAIACDWVDPTHTTIRSLHSKCLHVANLPAGYKNMGEFRKLFSSVTNPPYCQIALKNGSPQDWGLVEFMSADEAERTQQKMHGYVLQGSRLAVHFCMPGVRAIDIYMRLLNESAAPRARTALLPDPPAPAVYQQLKSLGQQNPTFAQNLQNIITGQISELQQEIARAQAKYGGPPPPPAHSPVHHQPPPPPPPPPAVRPPPAQLTQTMLLPGGQMVNLLPPPPPPQLAAATQFRPVVGPASPPYFLPGLGGPFLPTAAPGGFTGQFVTPVSSPLLLPQYLPPPPPLAAVPQPPPPAAAAVHDPVSDELQTTISSLMNKAQGLQQILTALNGQKGGGGGPVSPPAVSVQLPPTPPADTPAEAAQYLSSLLQSLQGAAGKIPAPALPLFTLPSPVTPQGQKRKYHHLLPSPEPSPENDYVGQHSQGLGGHYAQTYLKRTKRY